MIVVGRAALVRWNIPAWSYMALIPVLACTAYYAVEWPGRRRSHPLPGVIAGAGMVAAFSIFLTFAKPSYELFQ